MEVCPAWPHPMSPFISPVVRQLQVLLDCSLCLKCIDGVRIAGSLHLLKHLFFLFRRCWNYCIGTTRSIGVAAWWKGRGKGRGKGCARQKSSVDLGRSGGA
jgi:hypothetical protein